MLLLSVSIAGLFQIAHFNNNNNNLAAWAQAVPLIPIRTGNATLDQALPVFYDCIDETVDNSFSEEEPNYFHEEPTKVEVNQCYYDVFVINDAEMSAADEADYDNINNKNNDEEMPSQEEEAQPDEEEQAVILEEVPNDSPEQQQGIESFIVIPGNW